MNSINLNLILEQYAPEFLKKYPSWAQSLINGFLRHLLHINEIDTFLQRHPSVKDFELIREVFDYLDFTFVTSEKERQRIPAEGRLICVANHPLGALDALSVLLLIGSVRSDVKIVVNDVLMHLGPLRNLFIPVDVFSHASRRQSHQQIEFVLKNEGVVIFFPAAEVSRLGLNGLKDKKWMKGTLTYAKKYSAPILPIRVKSRNSALFYFLSWLNKSFSMLLLPNELFLKRHKKIELFIGDPIAGAHFKNSSLKPEKEIKLLRKHVYRLGSFQENRNRTIFHTEKTIIAPVSRRTLKHELHEENLLLDFGERFRLHLLNGDQAPNLLLEIARLREITFRKVGEGTGKRLDHDEYDRYYDHLILWDDKELEVVGAYRLLTIRDILPLRDFQGLYTHSLFGYQNASKSILEQSIELGRSFIQEKYWRHNALDYLWQGIGAYLNAKEGIRYLIGAVTISNTYPDPIKDLIVNYYTHWYPSPIQCVSPRNPYIPGKTSNSNEIKSVSSQTVDSDLRQLKEHLKIYGYSIPVLFRKYCDLCAPDGIAFLGFNIDPDFSGAVDGLILLDTYKFKPNRIKRYLKSHELMVEKIQLSS